ncbi:MAG: gamma-glutamyl-gamma-aminobutyrate hydrolase family protein [Candidatus Obscuribacterales bacterium]|nr:gamma-glutamyl-gamma-aminobutyrate hydrolase family protein [Candidatus Obscuribacterales bacterium]
MKIAAQKRTGIKTAVLVTILVQTSSSQAAETEEKPVIGINTDISGDKPEESRVQSTYIDAIRKAGGIPVLLAPLPEAELRQILKRIDGVLMIGGDDYPPSLYKQESHPTVQLMKTARSDFDISLARMLLKTQEIPVLGICAGAQALNIASGGSLKQDIPSMNPDSKIKHSSPQGWQKGFSKHLVSFEHKSKIAAALKQEKLEVVSSHHQCVDKVGDSFKITAQADDGVAEAIEAKSPRFMVGVQWHPERDYESNAGLFREFVLKAAEHHKNARN